MQKLLFIMNPYAGQRRANRYLAEIVSVFNDAGYQVTIFMTTGTGSAAALAQAHAKDHDLVVCAGGDGTLNETVTGILRSGVERPIGYIPCGTTNDFASSLDLPSNVVKAAQQIVRGNPLPYDAGRFADRYFAYVASFGAFTRSSYATHQTVKNALGHLAYMLEGIQELRQIRKVHMRFELDGEVIEDDFLFGAISNSTSVGGVLTLDPNQVDMGDGKFELLLVRQPKDTAELRECARALRTQKYDCKTITFRAVEKLTVSSDTPVTWTLDGERCDTNGPVFVENLHHAIHLMCGSEDI